jgi:4-hydroxy-tetrahydrodipicolinate synthase
MRGVHAILYALFDDQERLDRAAMRQQAEICLAANVAGIAALGLATEVAKLSFAERQTVMDWVAEDVSGRVPLGFTITGASVAEQIAMVRHAEGIGADWLILQPPAVGSYPAEEYLAFFGRVMRATALPVAIQNAPQYLGRGLSDEDITRLRADHANFTVIKSESSAEGAAKLIALVGPGLKVFNGRGGLEMIECLDAGCEGFLLAPDLVDYGVRVMQAYDAGDRAAALALHQETLPAIEFIMASIEHLICYGKRLFTARAGLPTHDRAPAQRPDAEGLAQVASFAQRFGSFPG